MALPVEWGQMRAWVYKVNARRPGRYTGWHFDHYFRYRGRAPYDMGGREWIRSPQSWACLRRVRRGHLFVCYQADERTIYGLARTASAGYENLPGSGVFDSVDFRPPRLGGALRLKEPVDVRQSEIFRHIRAFAVPSRGTIHALAADELRALLRELIASNPTQRPTILGFAKPRP
ncbi:MAG: hypothetical protein HY656_00885 [Acidobacteria bacterium]|nr:hypothetical protein [Acidobacteriota bacterium]